MQLSTTTPIFGRFFPSAVTLFFSLFLFSNGIFSQTQTYTTNGTFTVPAGVTAITVECWGGGGSGGGAAGNPAGGGGGAGGSYSRKTITVTPGEVYPVTIGAGGTGIEGAGNPGESTWFGSTSTVLAVGGAGGALATANGTSAAGAVASTIGNVGDQFYAGGDGGTGAGGNSAGGGGEGAADTSNGANGGVTTGGTGTNGGNGGDGGAITGNGGAGGTGMVPGGGGGGGRAGNNNDRRGGHGADGQVIVSWTCTTVDVSNFNVAVPNICQGESAVVNITSTSLANGTYDVLYTITGANTSATLSASLVFSGGSGSFTTPILPNNGTTTITILTVDCASVNKSNNANVRQAATVNAGAPASACISAMPTPITLSGAVLGGSATTGTWSITSLTPSNAGLDGTLSLTTATANPETVTYTPPANYSGTIILTLTTDVPSGACPAVSATKIITVHALPVAAITGNPSICGTLPALLTATGGVSFNWSTGDNTSLVSLSAAGTYTVTVTDINNCTNTATVITTAFSPLDGGTINNTPLDRLICAGGNPAGFTGTAVTGVTYQWEFSQDNGMTWTPAAGLGGVNTQNYNIPVGGIPDPEVTTQYRRVVTALVGGCTAVSANMPTVYVNTIPLGTITANEKQAICLGGTIGTIDATPVTGISGGSVTSATVTYQWQESPNGASGWVNAAGTSTNEDYTPIGLTATRYYRRVVSISVTATGTSPASVTCSNVPTGFQAVVGVNNFTPGTITTSTANNQTICTGADPAAFVATASVIPPEPVGGFVNRMYKWQSRPLGSTDPWTDVPMSDVEDLNLGAVVTANTEYQRIDFCEMTMDENFTITAACQAVATGGPAKITINTVDPGTITYDGAAPEICSGGDPANMTGTIPLNPQNATIQYQWQFSNTGMAPWANLAGAAALDPSYNPAAGLTATRHYRRRVRFVLNGVTCEAFSNVITVTVYPNPAVPTLINPANLTTECTTAAATYTFMVTPGLNGDQVEWTTEANFNNGSMSANYGIAGPGTPAFNAVLTLSPTNPTTPTTYVVRFRSKNSITGCVSTDVTRTVTIYPPATVNAGGDLVTCYNTAIPLSGVIGGGATAATWSASVGGGSFTPNATTLNATYTPSPTFAAAGGTITLTLTTNNPAGPCLAVNDQLVLTVLPKINPGTIEASSPVEFCAGGNPGVINNTAAATTTAAPPATISYVWEQSTDGSTWFPIPGETGATYDPPILTATTHYRRLAAVTGYPTPPTNGTTCYSLPSNVIVFTVNQAPAVTNQTLTVCSGEALDINLGPTTNGVIIDHYDIINIQSSGLVNTAGNPATGTNLSASEIADDAWENTTSGPLTVTYTVVPVSALGCEGEFTVIATVTEEPTVVCPANITVTTSEDQEPGDCLYEMSLLNPAIMGGCAPTTLNLSFSAGMPAPASLPLGAGPVVGEFSNIGFSVGVTHVTYTATDGNMNTGSCSFLVTVTDDEDPVITMPADISAIVACPDATDVLPVLPIVTDNCSGVLTPALTSSGTKPACEGTRTYVYTYTDAAGNDLEWTFTYTVEYEDFTLPVNEASTVNCETAAIAPTPPVVTDNCGNGITPTGPVRGGTYVDCEGTVTFTWTYKDCEQNSHDWTYTYTIDHTTAPTEVGGPVSATSTVECIASATAPTTLPVVKDVCGNVLQPTPNAPEVGGTYTDCEGTKTYTYNYVDCSGLPFAWTYTYIIDHTTAPTEVGTPVPVSSTVECIASATAPTILPVVKDVCGNTLQPAQGSPVMGGTYAGCEGTQTFTYNYTDCSGLTFAWTYTYTIDHTTAPTEIGGPVATSSTVQCEANALAPTTLPVVKDVCGNILQPAQGSPVMGGTYTNCEGTKTFTYTYEDCSGLTFAWTYTYTIDHTTAPTEIGGPVAISSTVQCEANAIAPTTLPVVKDVCGNILQPTQGSPVMGGTYTNCEGTKTYTYTYEDCSGLPFVWTYTYTIDHTTAPTEVGGPVATSSTVQCEANATAPTTLPVVKDVCGNVLQPTPTSPVMGGSYVDCEGTKTFSYTYEDCSGLPFVWTYTYTIDHTTAPTEVGGPVATSSTVQCITSATAPTTLPVVKDVCGNVLQPTPTSPVMGGTYVDCEGTQTFTYTYEDCSGLPFVWTYTYTIDHTTAPTEIGGPVATSSTVQCITSATTPTILPVVKDVCGNVLQPTPTSPVMGGSYVDCEGTKTFSYTYEDCSGLPFVWTYTYTIDHTSAPTEVGGPVAVSSTVECETDAIAPTILPVVEDVCGNVLQPSPNSPVIGGTYAGCEGTKTFTYNYIDCSGLPFAWTYTYTIDHATTPNEVGTPVPVSSTVECETDATAPTTLPLVEDVCGNVLQPTSPVMGGTYVDCEGTKTFTYTYEDCSGLPFVWTYTYTIDHTTAPTEVGGPVATSSTVQCITSATAPTILPVVEDVCGNVLQPTQGSPVMGGSYVDCEGTRTFTYTYEDCSGLPFVWTYTYTIDHTTAPTEVGTPVPVSNNVECETDAIAPTILPVVKDVCGNTLQPSPNSPVIGGTYAGCEGTKTFTYNYVDCSGLPFAWTYTYTIDHATTPNEVGTPVPVSSTVECETDATAPTTLPVVKDVCGNILQPSPNSPVTGGTYVDCEGTKTFNYRYEDCSGLTFIWTYTYTIDHTTAPTEIGGPVAASSTVQCITNATAPTTLPVVKDVCGNTLQPTQGSPVMGGTYVDCEGTKTYTYTYEDCSGLPFAWTYTYTIDHTTAPTEVGGPVPTSSTVQCEANATAPTTLPVVKDVCGNVLQPSPTSPVMGGTYVDCEGTKTFTYTYEDCSGLPFVWTYTYTIDHTTAPAEIGGPVAASSTVECEANAIAPTTLPVVKDVCGNILQPSPNSPVMGGSYVDCEGSKTFTYTYEDCSGLPFVWTYTYTIDHTTAPTEIGGPVAVSSTVECEANAIAPTTLPVVKDVCGNILQPTSTSPVMGGTYAGCEGTKTYTYTYEDCSGLPFVWTYTYTIEHTTAPTEIGGPVAVSSTVECETDATAPTTLPVVKDVCGTVLQPTQNSPVMGGTYVDCEGTKTFTYTYEDCSGLLFDWTYTYTIDHSTPPAVPSTGTQTVQCIADAVPPTIPAVLDVCGNPLQAVLVSTIDDPQQLVCEGTRTYNYSFTDCANLVSNWSFVYTIDDSTAPTVTSTDSPDDPDVDNYTCNTATFTINTDPLQCSAPVTIAIPGWADNCLGTVTKGRSTNNGTNLSGFGSFVSGNFPAGNTIVTFTGTDCANNTGICSITITVTDNQPPTIIGCPTNQTVNAAQGQCSAVVNINTPTAQDNCGINTITFNVSGATTNSGNGFLSNPTLNVGLNTILYTVTDAQGNSAACSFSITVVDNQPPVITCPAPVTVSNTTGLCSAVVEYTITATDNCSASVTATPASGSVFPVGQTTVTATATDPAGQSVSCTFTVTVNDTEGPVLSCPTSPIVVSNEAGLCSAVVQYTVTATDNCGSSLVQINYGGHESGSVFPVGVTTFTVTATDGASNSSTCTVTVDVNDTESPVISCPPTITVVANNTGCTGAHVQLTPPTASDNCGFTITSNAPTLFPVGPTVVTYTAADTSLNMASCTTMVVVTPAIVTATITGVAPTTICTGGSAVITVDVVATGPWTLILSDGTTATGTGAASATSITVSPTTPGVNTITLASLVDITGCPATLAGIAEITVIEDSELTILPESSTVCVGGSVEFTATLTGGSGCVISWESSPDNMVWTPTGSTGTAFLAANIQANTWYRAVVSCAGAGCGNDTSAVALVTVTPDPMVTVTGPTAACIGSIVTLNAAVTGGIGCTIAWETSVDNQIWLPTPFTGATFETPVLLPGQNYFRAVLNCTGNGCAGAPSNVLTINAAAITATLSGTQFICAGVSANLIVTINGSNAGPFTVEYTANNVAQTPVTLTTTTDTITVMPTANTTYKITKITDATGCMATGTALTGTATVGVNQPPTVAAGGDQTVCAGVPVLVTGTIGGTATSATWTSSGTGTFVNANLLATTYTPSVADIIAGTVTLTLTTNDPAGPCPPASDALVLNIIAPYTATLELSANAPVAICLGESTSLTVDFGTNAESPWIVVYEVNDIPVTVTATTNPFDISISPQENVIIELISVTSANGCIANIGGQGSVFVLVSPAPELTGTATDVSCFGASNGSIDLTVTNMNAVSPVQYEWSNGASTQDLSGLGAGTYTVTVTAGNGCTATASFTIIEPSLLTATTTVVNNTCMQEQNGSIDLTVSGGTPTYVYLWSNGASTQDISGLISNTYTVTVTDSKGCSTVVNAAVVFLDLVPPSFTFVPAETTINCNEPLPTPNATATDDVDQDVTITTNDITTPGNCPGNYTITRTFTATDDCGRTAAATQVIRVQDVTPPTFTIPANTTVSTNANCAYNAEPAVTGVPTDVTDNCTSTPTVSHTDVVVPGNCTGAFVITRTWTVSDSCNNSTTGTQIITITDDTAPTFIVPTGVTVFTNANCGYDIDPMVTGAPALVSDNCTTSPVIAYSDATNSICTGNITITRTWKATDDCGNTYIQTQIINIQDNTAPTFTVPGPASVFTNGDCLYNADSTITGAPTDVDDNCTTNPVISHTDVTTPGNCPGALTITRTWRVADDCGNVSTATQVITVSDNTAPLFTAPDNVTIDKDADCAYDASPAVTGEVTDATDNCTPVLDLDITFDDAVAIGQCSSDLIITRTWFVTDLCGNTATRTQIISVEDNTAPTFTVPEDVTIYTDAQCAYNAEVSETGDVDDEVDNCSLTPVVNHTDVVVDGQCPGSKIITRTWTVTDNCGNAFTQTQTITVVDNIPPSFVTPADITLYSDHACEYFTDPVDTGLPSSITDNCATNILVDFDDSVAPGLCEGSYIVSRTWSVTDGCSGNIATGIQIITVTDTISPTFTVPEPFTIFTDANCDYNADPSITGNVFDPSDNCTALAEVSYNDAVVPGQCEGSLFITRTWTVTDDCGNATTKTQIITVEDDINPTFTVPEDITIYTNSDCEYDASVAETGDVNDEQDNCTVEPTANYVDATVAGQCPGSKIITRTWTVTDDCGNATTGTQTITVEDNIAPTFEVPQNITIYTNANCAYNADTTITGVPVDVADNCATIVLVTYDDNIEPGACAGSFIITRTWSATDGCSGNTATANQIITVQDNTAPTFMVPVDITVNTNGDCIYDASTVVTGEVTNAADNCTTAPEVDFLDTTTPGQCEGSVIITRTWTVTDDCGNASTGTQIITVEDETAPTFVVPQNVTIATDNNCAYNDDPADTGEPTLVDDNCTTTPLVTYMDDFDAGNCEGSGVISRTWIVTDDCGNSSMQTQLIYVVDETAPMLVNIDQGDTSDITVNYSAIPPSFSLVGSDNCSTIVTVTFNETQDGGPCDAQYTITRTWTVEDCSGNTAQVDQVITVNFILTPGTIGASQTICAGETPASFSNLNGGSGYPTTAYRWETKTGIAGMWTTIPGETGPTYAPGALTQTTFYRRILVVSLPNNLTCESIPSNEIEITVLPLTPVVVTITAANLEVCPVESITFVATATNAGLNPTYVWKKNGITVATLTGTNLYTTGALVFPGDDGADITVEVIPSAEVVCPNPELAISNTLEIQVIEVVLPVINLTASSTLICPGETVNFTLGVTNADIMSSLFTWTVDNTAVASGFGLTTYSSSSLASGDSVKVTIVPFLSLCPAQSTVMSNIVEITHKPQTVPSVSITASANPICQGTPVTFTATAVNGGLTPVFVWKKNNITVGTNATTYTDTNIQTGDQITVILTPSAEICPSPATATATPIVMQVNPPAIVSITGLNTAYCQNAAAITLAGTPTGGTFTIDGNTATVFNPALLAVGAHLVAYTATDNNGCTGSTIQTVMVEQLVVATAGPDQTASTNVFTMAANNPAPGTGVWTIVTGSATINNTSSPTTAVTITSGATVVLAWTITNGNCVTADSVTLTQTGITVKMKALLQGAYAADQGKMRDNLRTLGLIPTVSPYGTGQTTTAAVFTVTGDNAIVDWVKVEIRDAADYTNILATRSALIQRDGDIVDVDGVSAVPFNTTFAGSYYVAIKHRNHLGIMTANPIALTMTTPVYNFTSSAASAFTDPMYTNAPMAVMTGKQVMWGGDVNGNTNVRYSGPDNDNSALLQGCLGGNAGLVITNVYSNCDLNMNGNIRYSGPSNDNSFLLQTVLGGNAALIIYQHF